ncbi:MAG: transketolase [Oligoflexus sp.]
MNDQQTINVLKGLVIDGVNKANSGHPGGAMSSMDFAYLLFTEYLQFDPANPRWLGRDRFILSAGHESMLLYTMLHLCGWLEMDELKRFRQLHSKTPGHPENFITTGVECTTGPLGQGAAMSVGFAAASRHFAERLDKELFSYRTWVIMGDGCVQEDVTLGAASLAGHLGLSNLIWYYDKNKVQISGGIDRSASDDYQKVFEGSGWEVLEIDGHDHSALRKAMDYAMTDRKKPLMIIGNTTIAKGAHSLEGSEKTHGSPLPSDERQKTKTKLGLPVDQDFYLPEDAVQHFQRKFAAKSEAVKGWQARLESCLAKADFAKLFKHCFEKEDFSQLPSCDWSSQKAVATRNAFGDVLEAWAHALPNLMGGSADLEPSNMTGAFAKTVGDFSRENALGRNLAFGVREFPMSAMCNGLALHGGIIPFDATFLSFADYSRPALRLNAIQKVRVIHEFTHDSFYLGEDGPTHQPVEHLMSLRIIPNFVVMRPADANETQVLMRHALELRDRPSALCLSRQKLPLLPVSAEQVALASRGAYVVQDATQPDLILIATGSEVSLALDAASMLTGMKVKVVSMPSWELFDEQDLSYRNEVLDPACTKRVSIEAGSTLGWQKYTGSNGLNIGFDRFGDSAPAEELAKEYGFVPEAVAARIHDWLANYSN